MTRMALFMMALLVVSMVLVSCVNARFVVQKSNIRILSPHNLRSSNHVGAMANFGVPNYGGSMVGSIVYPEKGYLGCNPFDGHEPFKSKSHRPTILLLDRGETKLFSQMTERWRFKLFMGTILAILLVFLQSLSPCFSLNTEGLALLKFRDSMVRDPFGKLEVLDLGYNNFSGPFPSDFGNNMSLTILLLDNNNFNVSPELYELQMLSEFQADENQLTSAALKASCNSKSSSWNTVQDVNVAQRRLLQHFKATNPPKVKRDRRSKRGFELSPFASIALSPSPSSSPSLLPSTVSPSVSPSNSPFSSFPFPPSGSISLPPDSPHAFPPDSLVPSPSPRPPTSPPSFSPSNPPLDSKPPLHHPAPWPSPASTSSQNIPQSFNSKHHTILLWSGVTVGSLFIFISALGIFYFRSNKVITVKPWATGLSGQLQKVFVTGVPKLQRSELEAACEDFSNIIGSISDGTVYKGTLSSGVEIAVTSTAVKSAEDWPKNLEAQYRKKIENAFTWAGLD